MSLFQLAYFGQALAITVGFVLFSEIIAWLVTRKRRWWWRCMAMLLPLVIVWAGWSSAMGPRVITSETELATKFEEVFGFAPPATATELKYQYVDGPDDRVEWFVFHAEESLIRRLSPDSQSFTPAQVPGKGPMAPTWWIPKLDAGMKCYQGSIPTKQGTSPWSSVATMVHDAGQQRLYVSIHSLL